MTSKHAISSRLDRSARLVLVLATSALIAVSGCGSGDTGELTEPAPSSQPSTEPATGPMDSASDAGELLLTEEGFTPLPVGDKLSFALVFNNTSQIDAIIGGTVRVRFLDASGGAVKQAGGTEADPLAVPLVKPGESTVLAGYFFPAEIEPQSMTVEIVSPQWLKAEDAVAGCDGEFSVGAVEHDTGAQDSTIHFDLGWNGGRPCDIAAATALFRDSSGAVLGGTPPIDGRLNRVEPGQGRASITVDTTDVPADTEPADTEIFIL